MGPMIHCMRIWHLASSLDISKWVPESITAGTSDAKCSLDADSLKPTGVATGIIDQLKSYLLTGIIAMEFNLTS